VAIAQGQALQPIKKSVEPERGSPVLLREVEHAALSETLVKQALTPFAIWMVISIINDHQQTKPRDRIGLGVSCNFSAAALLRQFGFEGLAAGILGHVTSLVGDARTNFNAACMARTGSIVMMAFFNLAVDTPGHRAHPLSLIVAQHSWMICNHA
jgi:hypothetical protein